jgi:predicted enzyme related to lactoylglutathione lyase
MAKPGGGFGTIFRHRREAVRRKLSGMEKVLGIGGVFFRARDPKALADWYDTHLGVTKTPTDYGNPPWFQGAGPTVWGAFKQDTKYFPVSQAWMVNFRVKDLDAMVKQLRDAGIKVDIDPEQYPNGRFARLYDPENNPIELWQPNGPYAGA